MTVYLGQIGRMIELWSTPSAQVQTDDRYTFLTTVEGKRRAQRRPVGRREWSVNADYSTTAEAAALSDFASGAWGPGPFVFVSAEAPVTNMLTPAAASCDPAAGMGSTNSEGGPMLTNDGWAPRSIRSGSGADIWFGDERVPIIEGEPVTVSAYVEGSGAAVRVTWYTADGSTLGSDTSRVTATAATTVRSWITVSPPAGAAALRVRAANAVRGSRPSVTRGELLYPWADGRGCSQAVVTAVGRDVVLAGRGLNRQFESVSYTVTEVG